jgi:ribosomal protein S20
VLGNLDTFRPKIAIKREMKGKSKKSKPMETFYTKVLSEVVAYNQQRMQQAVYPLSERPTKPNSS